MGVQWGPISLIGFAGPRGSPAATCSRTTRTSAPCLPSCPPEPCASPPSQRQSTSLSPAAPGCLCSPPGSPVPSPTAARPGIASSRSPVVFIGLVPPPVLKRQRCPEPAVVRVVDGVGLADKADPRPSVRHSPRLEVLRKLVCCAARPLPPLCPSTSPAAPLRIARGSACQAPSP